MNTKWSILYQEKYKLPRELINKVVHFVEFANGGTQASIKLRSGKIINNVLISNASYIVAIEGFRSMPFSIDEVCDIYQSEEDKTVEDKNKWECWTE